MLGEPLLAWAVGEVAVPAPAPTTVGRPRPCWSHRQPALPPPPLVAFAADPALAPADFLSWTRRAVRLWARSPAARLPFLPLPPPPPVGPAPAGRFGRRPRPRLPATPLLVASARRLLVGRPRKMLSVALFDATWSEGPTCQ
nr:wiskott-Aldrich syndrome protein family member 2-like [Aegilops tauschii subsp. strangulata]